MTGRRWTSEDIAQLRKLASRHALPQVAEMLGRTPNAVQQKAIQVGVSFRHDHWTSEEIIQLRKLAKTHTGAQVGEMLGRTYKAVMRKACLLNIPFQKYGEAHHCVTVSDEQVREAVAEYWRGESTQKEIADRLGVTHGPVSSWINGTSRTWRTG